MKRYGVGRAVIHGVRFEANEGEFVVFVGPSGCGKSTLLRMIAGLEEVTDGDVYIDSRLVTDVGSGGPPSLDGVSVLCAFSAHERLRQHRFWAQDGQDARRSDQDAGRRGSAHSADRPSARPQAASELSGGQRQRVAIGRAIVRHPKLFLFDEPLSNLDAELRTQMRVEIAKLHRDLGVTMVYVTHDQVEAMTLADRIVVLRAGLIEQVGSPSQLYDEPANRFVAGFIGSPKMNFIEAKAVESGERSITVAHPAFVGGKLTIDRAPKRAVAPGAGVTVGLRPDSLALGAAEAAAQPDVRLLGKPRRAYADLRDCARRAANRLPRQWTSGESSEARPSRSVSAQAESTSSIMKEQRFDEGRSALLALLVTNGLRIGLSRRVRDRRLA